MPNVVFSVMVSVEACTFYNTRNLDEPYGYDSSTLNWMIEGIFLFSFVRQKNRIIKKMQIEG